MKIRQKPKFDTNKLVLVPATLLIALLSFLGGTQYEKQVKDILEQPNILTTVFYMQVFLDNDMIIL